VLLLGVSPASAERQTFRDRANDAQRGVDIRTVHVSNAGRILVRTKFDYLGRRGSTGLAIYFDTNRRNAGPEYLAAGGLFEGSDSILGRIAGWNDQFADWSSGCRYDLRIHYGRGGTATIDLARGCLRRPGEIRATAKSNGPGRNDWAPRRRTFYPAVDHG